MAPSQSKIEQRTNIKFCVKLGKGVKETIRQIKKAYGKAAIAERNIYRWFNKYSSGYDEVVDKQRGGRPVSSFDDQTIKAIEADVMDNRQISIRELAEKHDLSYGTVQRILTKNCLLKKVSAKWVPHDLTQEQKDRRVKASRDFLAKYRRDGDDFLNKIITSDESLLSFYIPETTQQSSSWKHDNSPTPTKPKIVPGIPQKKQMVVTFFDIRGMVLTHFVPIGQRINAVYIAKVLKRDLQRSLRKKRPGHLQQFILHWDNAPTHTAILTSNTVQTLGFQQLEHAPYSPDLAPSDFYLYGELKRNLSGNNFQSCEELKNAVVLALQGMSSNGFNSVFKEWVSRHEKCVANGGNYVE